MVTEWKKIRATLTIETPGMPEESPNFTELSSADWTLRATIEPSTNAMPAGIFCWASALAGSGGTPGVKHVLGMIVRGVEGLLQYSFEIARALLSNVSIWKSYFWPACRIIGT